MTPRNLMLATALVGLFAIELRAQNPNQGGGNQYGNQQRENLTPQQRAQKDADRAEKQLALTADQKARWGAAALERANANEPLQQKMKASTTPDERKSIRNQMEGNKEKFNAAIASILTPDQKAKYDQIQSERQSLMRNGKGGGGH